MAKRREIAGWALFDVANSAYTTIIITVAFNVVFSKLIVPGDYSFGGFLWSIVLSISWFLTAMLGPLFGAVSDIAQKKKLFLAFSVILCCLATSSMYFISPGQVLFASILLIVSNLGFALSENFISAFLPHIASERDIGKISGLAWGLGYFGGLGSIVICHSVTGFSYDIGNFDKLRLLGPLTALFFICFSLPTFIFVQEPKKDLSHILPQSILKHASSAYQEILHTLSSLRSYRDLAVFLVSFFFFQGGLAIVISFSSIYADQVVNLGSSWQAIFFITLQISAALGAFTFGYLQGFIGAVRTVSITLVIWIVTILLIYFLESLAEILQIENIKLLFVAVGNLAGLCLGATQASARALVGLFSPPSKSGEFYGFWGLAGKLAAVFAVVAFGVLQHLLNLKTAMLFCISFFIIGLILNLFVDEKRGIKNAH